MRFLQHIWKGFLLKEALNPTAIKEFLLLGFPGMLQSVFAWIAFEAIALLCGILPGDEAIIGIGANAIILYVGNMTYLHAILSGGCIWKCTHRQCSWCRRCTLGRGSIFPHRGRWSNHGYDQHCIPFDFP